MLEHGRFNRSNSLSGSPAPTAAVRIRRRQAYNNPCGGNPCANPSYRAVLLLLVQIRRLPFVYDAQEHTKSI